MKTLLFLILTAMPLMLPMTAHAAKDEIGTPIFHIDDNRWFQLRFHDDGRPDTAIDIQQQRNEKQATENAEEDNRRDALYPDELKFMNDLRLEYKFRFK